MCKVYWLLTSIFTTLSNILDGVFYENSQRLKAVNYFCKSAPSQILIGFWTHLWVTCKDFRKAYLSKIPENVTGLLWIYSTLSHNMNKRVKVTAQHFDATLQHPTKFIRGLSNIVCGTGFVISPSMNHFSKRNGVEGQ